METKSIRRLPPQWQLRKKGGRYRGNVAKAIEGKQSAPSGEEKALALASLALGRHGQEDRKMLLRVTTAKPENDTKTGGAFPPRQRTLPNIPVMVDSTFPEAAQRRP